MSRIIKSIILITISFVFLLPIISPSTVKANRGVMEFVSTYNSFADYLTQQNASKLQTASFQDIKINFLSKTDNPHMYAGLLSDGIAVYLIEENYGNFKGLVFSYSIKVNNKENASNEMLRRGELIGAAITLSLFTMGVPHNVIEKYMNPQSELYQVLYKSWKDRSRRYNMTTYSPSNRRNIILSQGYDGKSERFMATLIYQ